MGNNSICADDCAIGWNILCDYCICTYSNIVTNFYRPYNFRSGANIYIVSYCWSLPFMSNILLTYCNLLINCTVITY